MDNKVIYDLVANIEPIDRLEKEHCHDTLKWVLSGAELCRLTKPALPPKHLVSYCILLDVPLRKILLVHHKNACLWLPAGGHVEPGEHPAETADRELKEELGVSLTLLQPDPVFLTVTETVGTTAGHIDVSFWYVYKCCSSVNFTEDKEEFHDIRWFLLDELPKETDPHLERFCQKLERAILNR